MCEGMDMAVFQQNIVYGHGNLSFIYFKHVMK